MMMKLHLNQVSKGKSLLSKKHKVPVRSFQRLAVSKGRGFGGIFKGKTLKQKKKGMK